ncbi:MAG: UvrD-helicase domain-containing protein, partial [Proteobacteria bacterium]|nr:UvrD-helicase domain-containing protein [Pseudomonadota bacterium]
SCLVASGANPSKILTLTFTQKAALQMKTRILERAYDLEKDPQARGEFDDMITQFYQHAQQTYQSSSLPSLTKPLSAQATAQKIQEHMSSLPVMTIDSWLKKISDQFGTQSRFNSPVRDASIMEESEFVRISEETWHSFFPWPWLNVTDHHRMSFMASLDAESKGLAALKRLLASGHVKPLDIHKHCAEFEKFAMKWFREGFHDPDSYQPFVILSHLKKQKQKEICLLLAQSTQDSSAQMISQKFAESVCHDLINLFQKVPKKKQPPELSSPSFDVLRRLSLITKSGKVSKNAFRQSLREQFDLTADISLINKKIEVFSDYFLLDHLAQKYENLHQVFLNYRDRLEYFRQQKKYATFDDYTRVCYDLFLSHHEDACRAQAVILNQTSHLLIDELQDTNQLQWDIFAMMARELMSGGCEQPRTVFMVGDAKQCLYSFRDAYPYVVELCAELMDSMGGKTVDLTFNYRTTALVCDYITQVFSALIPLADFLPPQSRADVRTKTQSATTKNLSSVTLVTVPFDPQQRLAQGLAEKEADVLARHILQIMAHPDNYPVYGSGGTRRIKLTDMAVLYRKSTHVDIFRRAFVRHGLAVSLDEEFGFFERIEIKDCLHLLKLCAYPSDLCSLLAVAKSPIGQVSDQDVLDFLATRVEPNHAPTQ